jgi:hypothetical protein
MGIICKNISGLNTGELHLCGRLPTLKQRFMSSLNRVFRTSQIEGKCWQQDLNAFLRAYRNTPHCMTQKTPSELLFHRAVRMTLPESADISENLQTQDADLSLTDLNAKQKMKVYADSRRHAKSKHLQVGDYVLVKLAKKDKLYRLKLL